MADDLAFTTEAAGRDAAPRSVMAFFDTEEAAGQARRDLVAAGVPEGSVRAAGGQATEPGPAHPHGFWESLKDFFVPDEDRHMYAEGLRRGGYAVAVDTDSAAYDRVLEILDRDGAVDMEERSASWRGEGWDGLGGPEADRRALGEREMSYAPAGNATGGFAASRADQPLFEGPMDNAAIEPGLVTPMSDAPHRAGSPDAAYAAAAPGLPSAADTARDTTAMPGQLQPTPSRDLGHGRARVRSYLGGDPDMGTAERP